MWRERLDDRVKENLRKLPPSEVENALRKCRFAESSDKWLMGYCRKYWQDQRAESETQAPPNLDDDSKNLLSQLPCREAQQALQWLKEVDPKDPSAWLRHYYASPQEKKPYQTW
ncbi:unnamed protein product [Durusdinium trenchii]|uniref:Uncharacterized protein n=1 Tax=Durusdinium trenchii TaxID=1381693 RepID=A0ABP0NIH0_9DINO